MTAWVQKSVDVLPDIEDGEPFTTYKLPNGTVWVPDNMFDFGRPTKWITDDEFWDRVESDLEQDESR